MKYEYRGILVVKTIIEGKKYEGLDSLYGISKNVDRDTTAIFLPEDEFNKFVEDLKPGDTNAPE